MSRKRDIGHDGIQEEILRKLEDSSTQRQIDIGGGVVVNITQEDYGESQIKSYRKQIPSIFSYLRLYTWLILASFVLTDG